MKLFGAVAFIGFALLLQGCAGSVSRVDSTNFDNMMKAGDYANASKLALTSGHVKPTGETDNLVWSLQAGSTLLYTGDAKNAVPVLDGAEKMMAQRDSSTFTSQFKYATYDGIMADTYTALSFFAAGNPNDARVEFNRVRDRQSRAEELFAAEKAKIDRDTTGQQSGKNVNFDGALNQASNNPQYQSATLELAKFASYKTLINPYASYLTGIYLANAAQTSSDLDKARDELIRVRDMVGNNATIDADLALVKRRDSKPKTWVIFEDGQAPTFIEERITFPIPVVGRTTYISAVTVAYPRMVFHQSAYPALIVTGGGARMQTSSVGSFDSVMATEFQRRLPSIMARTITEAAIKVAAQEALNQVNPGSNAGANIALAIMKIGTAVAANISTADTRSWTALPKDFQATRIDTPADGDVHVSNMGGQEIGSVTVPVDRSSLAYPVDADTR